MYSRKQPNSVGIDFKIIWYKIQISEFNNYHSMRFFTSYIFIMNIWFYEMYYSIIMLNNFNQNQNNLNRLNSVETGQYWIPSKVFKNFLIVQYYINSHNRKHNYFLYRLFSYMFFLPNITRFFFFYVSSLIPFDIDYHSIATLILFSFTACLEKGHDSKNDTYTR